MIMTLEECYNAFGGNYRDVLARLIKEERVERFIKSFPSQDMISPIEKSISEKNYKQAFFDAHTLKGLCATLGLSKLYKSVSELTESMRGEELSGDPVALLKAAKEDYKLTVDTIAKLD